MTREHEENVPFPLNQDHAFLELNIAGICFIMHIAENPIL